MQVTGEAEQRHLQIMKEVLQGMRHEWASKLIQKEQEFEQRIQDAESGAVAAIAEVKRRADELEVRLNQAQALYDAKVHEIKAEANAKHDLKIAEEWARHHKRV